MDQLHSEHPTSRVLVARARVFGDAGEDGVVHVGKPGVSGRGGGFPGRAPRGARRSGVLVIGAGDPTGRTIAEELVTRGKRVVGVDTDSTRSDGVEAAYLIPPVTDPGWLSALRRIIDDERITVVLPTHPSQLPLLAAARSGLPADVDVVVAGLGPVALAVDQLFTAWRLQSRGLSVPPTADVVEFADGSAAFAALGGPLIVKARHEGFQRRPVAIANTPAELDLAGWDAGDLLQRYVPGAEYCVVQYRPRTQREGRPLLVVIEKDSVRQENGTVNMRRVTGQAVFDVGGLAVGSIRAIGLAGPSEVTIRRDADGTPHVVGVRAGFGPGIVAVPEQLDHVMASVSSSHRPRA